MYKIILYLVLILFFSSGYSQSHWKQKDGFLELNEYKDTLNWLKISPDGKYLFSLTNHSVIKKYDIETGDTIKSWTINHTYSSFDLNTEEESIIIIESEQVSWGFYFTIKKFMLDSDSLIFSFDPPLDGPDYSQMGWTLFTSMDIKISANNHNFLLYGRTLGKQEGSIDYEYAGRVNLFDMKTGKLVYKYNNWNNRWALPISVTIGENQFFAYSAVHDEKYYHQDPFEYYYNNILFDSAQFVNLSGGLVKDELASNLSFSRDNNILLGIGNSQFNLWNVQTGNLIKAYNTNNYIGFDYNLYNLFWTGNNNIFLHSYSLIQKSDTSNKKSIIKFYDRNFPVAIDSMVFNGKSQNYSFCLGPDSTSFFTLSEENIIRWFKPIILSNSLKAYFVSDKNLVLQKDTVNFIDGSIGNPLSYLWDFGDGITSTEKNPYHFWYFPGEYTIKLIISNGIISDTLIRRDYIKVNKSLRADFEADIYSGDPPLTVTFQNLSIGDIQKYYWWFGDGGTDTSKNPVHIYKNPGIFPVKLIVFDGSFYDTLLVPDYINVNRQTVSDSNFDLEKIVNLAYTDISGTAAFEGSEEFYLAEGYSKSKTTILGFNKYFKQEWSKSLYTNYIHQPIQKAKDNMYYLIGDTVTKTNTVHLNRFNDLGEISSSVSYSGNNLLFSYVVDSLGYWTFYASNIKSLGDIIMNSLNNNDSLILNFKWHLLSGYYDYCNSLKSCYGFNNNCILFFDHIFYPDPFQDSTLVFFERNLKSIDRQVNITNIYDTFNQNKSNISDLVSTSQTKIIYLESNKLYSYEQNIGAKLIASPSANITSIQFLPPYKIVLCGAKNGYCWYEIMNDTGKIYEEHTILERPGVFYSVSVNKDNSLLFSGLVNKNLNESYLYLYKTKIQILTEVIKNNNNFLSIYPNPTQDYLEIKFNSNNNSNFKINIFNELSIPVYENNIINIGNSCSISIDTKNFPIGTYYCQIISGNEVKIGNFVIIR